MNLVYPSVIVFEIAYKTWQLFLQEVNKADLTGLLK